MAIPDTGQVTNTLRASAHSRFPNINILRAAAALGVVVYHVIEFTNWNSFPVQGPLVAFRVGWLGVHLFLVISGFVIAFSALSAYRKTPIEFAKTYWRHRLARIVPLYFLTLILWMLVFWPQFAGMGAGEIARQVLSHMTFTHNLSSSTHSTIDG